MRWIDYVKDKVTHILVQIACMMLFAGFLLGVGNSMDCVILILIMWIMIDFIVAGVDYWKRKRYFTNLHQLLQSLDQKYLIAEVMKPTHRLEDKLYHNILRKSNKSVIERIHRLEEEQQDYKDYIERWIHEVKAPITSITLMCENNKTENSRKLQTELSKIDNYVDMALFYARSDRVYQDYLIKETNLQEIVFYVISKNKQNLMEHQVQIEVEVTQNCVPTDEKWVSFILNQIVLNCVKYKKETDSKIQIYTKQGNQSLQLYVKDNGIGMSERDLRRIFDKGFTGVNGRNNGKSTGIGLYLCKKLCDQLDLGIRAESVEGEYTKMILTFPYSNYLSKL